jgi:hypothetical protein
MKEYDRNMLVGASVSNVRKMSAKELEVHGWDDNRGFNPVYVIELDNGISLYPSRDAEGNGGGVLFGVDENDLKCFTVCEKGQGGVAVDTSHLNNDDFGAYIRGEIAVDGKKIKTPLKS